jgi:hypothetical protein
MLVASFCAGWVSHRAWQRKNIEQATVDAMLQLGGPVRVEKVDGLDVMMLKGHKADVEAMQGAIGKIQDAAQK